MVYWVMVVVAMGVMALVGVVVGVVVGVGVGTVVVDARRVIVV